MWCWVHATYYYTLLFLYLTYFISKERNRKAELPHKDKFKANAVQMMKDGLMWASSKIPLPLSQSLSHLAFIVLYLLIFF